MSNVNLPLPATHFIGRDRELAQIRQWLSDPMHRLISLVGLGGVGKTRLAIEAARQSPDYFPDGVVFVRLRPLDLPDLILPAIAEAARLTASPGVELKQQMAGFLDGKHKLLVLDSFEHLLAGVDVVIDLLQFAPEVKLLITSREKLNIQDETVLHVGPLTYPEQEHGIEPEQYSSVSMFLSLLQRVEPELSISPEMLADASLICRQVQGLPLAIELAVAWADTLSLKEIAQEIARSIDFLETRKRDSADRHRNIRAVLEPSLQTLPDTDRAIMEQLCVFRSSFTREAAEAIAGATLQSLALLVNKSLIRRRAAGGYDIHELVRQYGEARLSSVPGQREAAQERFRLYYVAFLDARWQEMKSATRRSAIERMEAELANCLLAFHSMIDNGNEAQIWHSMNALWSYFAISSRFNEGALIFEKSVEALRASRDEPLIGSLLLRQGFFLACQGGVDDGDKAERLADEGMALLARHQSDISAEMLIVAYICAGIIRWFAGKSQQMKADAQQGLDYAVEAQHHFGISLTMCLLGRAEFKLGNYPRAREIGQACYEEASQQNDAWIQGFIAFNILAEVAFVQQAYEEAQEWCRTAQRCFEGDREPWTLGTTLMLTICAVALRDFAEARNQWNICRQLLEEKGMMSQIPALLLRVAKLLLGRQLLEYAVGAVYLVIRHPNSRKVTHDEASRLLSQLESVMPPNRFASALRYAEVLERSGVIDIFPDVPSSPMKPQRSDDDLSERELDVLRLIAEGLSNAELAQRLYLSVGTVKVHARHIFDKLGVNKRTQAVAEAKKRGIL
jgi:predicted ATPase/DNA-binding CsgD family transcriptional regulator